MKKRKLGDLEVPAMGLGCWGMSGAYGKGDRKESIATIHRSIDIGVNFLDTADVYGSGHNEQLVAEAIHGIRNEVIVATKFGYIENPDGSMKVRCDGEYVKKACEESLRRLKTDHIDLYYMHRLDKDVPVEETVGAMAGLVKEGKVRYLGLSEVSVATIARAMKVSPITAVQSEYSLFTRDIEKEVMRFCQENGIGIVPFSPLSRAMLTGTIKTLDNLAEDDFRRNQPRWQGDNFSSNIELVTIIEEIASRNSIKASQVALAWIMSKGENIVPIPGMKSRKYLEENYGATEIELPGNDIDVLDEISGKIAGARYTESSYRFLDI